MLTLGDVDPKAHICPDCNSLRGISCFTAGWPRGGTHLSRIRKAYESRHLRMISDAREAEASELVRVRFGGKD